MDLQLKGKRALVTGSTSGIGRAIATALAKEGALVVIHGRDKRRAEEEAAAIADHGERALVALGDLSREDDAATVVQYVLSEIGGVDILVNNVGGSDNDGWSNAEPEDWAAMLNLNVVSTVRLILAFTPRMREQRWGRADPNRKRRQRKSTPKHGWLWGGEGGACQSDGQPGQGARRYRGDIEHRQPGTDPD